MSCFICGGDHIELHCEAWLAYRWYKEIGHTWPWPKRECPVQGAP